MVERLASSKSFTTVAPGTQRLHWTRSSALRRLTVTIDALSARSTSLYDAQGNLTGTQDFNGTLTAYLFDTLNRASVAIDGNGGRTTTLYDSAGNVTGVDDSDGHLTQYLLDADGRVTGTVYFDGLRTTTVYDAAGNVTLQTDIYSRATTMQYDALNRVTLSVDAEHTTTNLYDAAGNLTGTYDYGGNLMAYLYDGLNRVTLSIDGGGHSTTTLYDHAGNATSVDVGGDQTQYLFDNLNRATVTIDALGQRTTSVFDAAGNLTEMTDPDLNVTTFTYDADERQVTQTDPFGHTTTYAYNAAGLLTDTTDRLGRQIQYSYDADDRVTGQTWVASDGTTVDQLLTFTYDGDGNELTSQSASGTYTLSYDGLGRVTGVLEPFSQRLTFSYDARGNRTVVQDSQGGLTTSTYDDNNQLVELDQTTSGSAPLRVNLTYNQLGQNEGITRYNSLDGLATEVVASTSITYDVYGRETNIHQVDGSGTNLTNVTYTYDAQGWVSTQTRDSTTVTYTYDADGQLTGDGATTVTYDDNGNRNNGSNTPGTANQLTTDGTWDYTYDLEGNETKKVNVGTGETWTYGYDERNELQWADDRVTDGGTLISQTTFEYDAHGNRIEQEVQDGSGTSVQQYALDGWNPALAGATGNANWNVWADIDGLKLELESKYLRGDGVDQIFARVDKTLSTYTPYWTLTDHLGSVIAVTDDSGTVQASVHYDGWGKATITGSDTAALGRYQWTGREYDAETKLQYNRARYYDAGTGRWMSQDPLGFDAGDSNLYRYVSNSPVESTDPAGLKPFIPRTVDNFGVIVTTNIDGKVYRNDRLDPKKTGGFGGEVIVSPNALVDGKTKVAFVAYNNNTQAENVRWIQLFRIYIRPVIKAKVGGKDIEVLGKGTVKLAIPDFTGNWGKPFLTSAYDRDAPANNTFKYYVDVVAKDAKSPYYFDDTEGKGRTYLGKYGGTLSWIADTPTIVDRWAKLLKDLQNQRGQLPKGVQTNVVWMQFDDFAVSAKTNEAFAHVGWAAYSSLDNIGQKNLVDEMDGNNKTLMLDGTRNIIRQPFKISPQLTPGC